MTDPLKWVSSVATGKDRTRHYRDCSHFVDEIDPREATPAEMDELRRCKDCLDKSPSVRTDEFTCTSCGVVKRLTQRVEDGLCSDCA